MCKKILISLTFLGFAGSMISLVFVAFHKTQDSGALGVISVCISLLLAGVMYFFVFDDDCNHEVYTLISFGICLLLSTFIIKWVDNTYSTQNVSAIEFQIVGMGTTRVKSTEFTYLRLKNRNGVIKYDIEKSDMSEFKVGESVSLNATIGFFGYPTFK
ncbi:hypothetical protein [Photobacterium nomapromontoriensis]|uniref:hypothetical protein n=1 Tax=Photobacterium nomapromontoriensis TaxID=2910237 RepID=UPI003D124734